MKFYTRDFEDFGSIPARFTSDGENKSPAFVVENVPSEAVALGLVCHDPDATRGFPWVHWLIWSMPVDVKVITDSELPDSAIRGLTSFGNDSYGGPSPSPGTGPHRYVFTLYALKSIPQHESSELPYKTIVSAFEPISLDSATWTGVYER